MSLFSENKENDDSNTTNNDINSDHVDNENLFSSCNNYSI